MSNITKLAVEISDLLGLANVFLNTSQKKQLKVIQLMLAKQNHILEQLDDIQKTVHDRKEKDNE